MADVPLLPKENMFRPLFIYIHTIWTPYPNGKVNNTLKIFQNKFKQVTKSEHIYQI